MLGIMLQLEILSATGKIFVDEPAGDSGGFLKPAITFCFLSVPRPILAPVPYSFPRSFSGRICWRGRDMRKLY